MIEHTIVEIVEITSIVRREKDETERILSEDCRRFVQEEYTNRLGVDQVNIKSTKVFPREVEEDG